jgi:hypothetical protein
MASHWWCIFTTLAFSINQLVRPSSCGPKVGDHAKWKKDQTCWSTWLVQLQLDRRCWELSWLAWHKGHVGLCCIPLAAKLPAVRIFSCRAVHPKKTTFGSALYQLPQIYKFMQLLACRDATQCINPVVVQELLCYCSSFWGVLINLYRLWSDFFLVLALIDIYHARIVPSPGCPALFS